MTAFTHAGILLVVFGNKLVALHRVLTEPGLSLDAQGGESTGALLQDGDATVVPIGRSMGMAAA